MRTARYLARRVLGPAAIAALAIAAVVLLPVVAVVESAMLVGRLFGRRPRWRAVRCTAFAIAYTVSECACQLTCLILWLRSPVPAWRDTAGWQAGHARLLRRLLDNLLRAAEVLFGFRLRLESREGHGLEPDRPLVVLARHAGPGASFVLVHALLALGRVPRIVLKTRLRLDPALDVLLTRIGCAFIGGTGSTAAVAELAATLRPDDALVIFPEGGDWTPARHRRAVRRLRLRGLGSRADTAAARPNVLPPRSGGTLAALRGAPDAQVAVFMHTGHDDLVDPIALWQALPLQRELHMVWWRQPRPSLDTEAGCTDWLDRLWGGIDTWIAAQSSSADLADRPGTIRPPSASAGPGPK